MGRNEWLKVSRQPTAVILKAAHEVVLYQYYPHKTQQAPAMQATASFPYWGNGNDE
jgi:hypothetical protein